MAPHSRLHFTLHLKPIGTGGKLSKTDLASLRLYPGVGVGSDSVAKGRVVAAIGQHREPESQRMGRGIEIRILRGQIVAEHRSDERRRQDESRLGRRVKPRQAGAGSEPDGPIGLGEISVRVAVIPDQAIGRVIVCPAIALEHGDPAVGSQPVPVARVKELRVDDIAGKAIVHRKVLQLNFPAGEVDPRDPAGREIVDPQRPIRADHDRLNPIILQPIGFGQQAAHRPLLDVEPLLAGDEQAVPGSFDIEDGCAINRKRHGFEFRTAGGKTHDAARCRHPNRAGGVTVDIVDRELREGVGKEGRSLSGGFGDNTAAGHASGFETFPPRASHPFPRPVHTP